MHYTSAVTHVSPCLFFSFARNNNARMGYMHHPPSLAARTRARTLARICASHGAPRTLLAKQRRTMVWPVVGGALYELN